MNIDQQVSATQYYYKTLVASSAPVLDRTETITYYGWIGGGYIIFKLVVAIVIIGLVIRMNFKHRHARARRSRVF